MQTFLQKTDEQIPEKKTNNNHDESIQRKTISATEFLKPNATVQRKKENNTGLPDNLKNGVESLSGISLDDVSVHYNSDKPAQMKAMAYTQGADIHVAPGQEQHLGHEAWHVVQQKQGRVAPTMQMKGMNINDNYGLEHEADVMGGKALQMKYIEGSGVIQQKALENADAPMQFWGLGQHEEITEKAMNLSKKAQNANYDPTSKQSKKDMKSLKYGATFNDVHGHNTAVFGAEFVTHTDDFLNESHHGGMQFLHTMSNDEDAETNKEKQMAWANFCILTRKNEADIDGNTFQNKHMLEYIRSLGQNDIFYEMMMPAMLHWTHSNMFNNDFKKFLSRAGLNKKNLSPEQLAWAVDIFLIEHDDYKSPLADQTIEEFFQAGDKNMDAGLVASGSLAHMIEDSFANSHAQRITNLNADASQLDENARIEKLNSNTAAEDILNMNTDIMLHANYNEQQSLAVFGKHGKADAFDGSLEKSQGANQAELSVAYVLKKLDEGENKDDLLKFIDSTLMVDNNVLALQKIEQLKKNQNKNTQQEINEALAGTDLAGLGIDFLKNDVTTTKAGRQYEKTTRRFGHSSFLNGKGWMSKEPKGKAKDWLVKYDKLLQKEQTNTIYTPEEKLEQYNQQVFALFNAIQFVKNPETTVNIKKHATEMLMNVISMQKQSPEHKGEFEALKQQIVQIINS